ncbi:MAG: sugar transferase [Planctomycetota bacterium]
MPEPTTTTTDTAAPAPMRANPVTRPRRRRDLAAWRIRQQALTLGIAVVDVAVMVGAVLVGYAILAAIWPALPESWRDLSLGYLHPNLHVWYKTALVAFTVVAIYTFAVHGLYRPQMLRQHGAQAALAVRAASVLSAFFYFAVWMDRTNYCIERQIVVLIAWLVSCLLFLVWRGWAVPGLLRVGLWRRRTIVLGAGKSGQFLASQRRRFDRAGFELVGFLDDNAALHGSEIGDLPVLGPIDDATLKVVLAGQPVHEAVLAISNLSHARMLELVALCKRHGLGLRVLSDRWGILADKVNVETVSGVALIGVRETPLYGLNAFLKRAGDVTGSVLLLLLLSPLLLATALAVKLTSRGPALFVQERVGLNGRHFRYYKFRSMKADNDDSQHREFVTALIRGEDVGVEDESGQKVRKIVNDPRVTRVGRFIRKYSIDELPQLWNVLRGDMSLVGPRPSLPYEVAAWDDWHRRRLAVRPGLTGLWQVSGRSEVTFDDMVVLDIWYIENWSLWLDIQILIVTPLVVIAPKGAW